MRAVMAVTLWREARAGVRCVARRSGVTPSSHSTTRTLSTAGVVSGKAGLVWTLTDEAPALATYSFLPVVEAFSKEAGIDVETKDISLSGRILAQFSDTLPQSQQIPDALAELGALAKTPEANIIKLPNISASVPQLKAAISELQSQGFDIPDYPEHTGCAEAADTRMRYDKVKGSAVNPVLREGNSDRRAPPAVKEFARANPHRMGKWSHESKTHVATMSDGDFRSNEKSAVMQTGDVLTIQHVREGGVVTPLKEGLAVQPGEVIDASIMEIEPLDAFLKEQIQDAKDKGVLFSLHMKATMMKVSDPIIFGRAVRAYLANTCATHHEAIEEIGVNFNDGLGAVLDQIRKSNYHPVAVDAILGDFEKEMKAAAPIAMVDSDRGITNLHVPSDVIIDASMPAMIRDSGKMWSAAGELEDAKAVIPDSSYADLYQATIDFHREHGAFDPTTMGTVPNVGLMAQKAEEYGSHDKTFQISEELGEGVVQVINSAGDVIFAHHVGVGDIWRMCQTKDAPIRDWVGLAIRRARATNTPAVFWLDATRPHDAMLIGKVNEYLKDHDTSGLTIEIKSVADAATYTLERLKKGEDTISVTGNVLRDYLTDLFPILELGTSAKMLSIVPLMNGGSLFETGAGGSAPKHVQQMEKESHLRWDSLGEFLALASSYEFIANVHSNKEAAVLGEALNDATTKYLLNNKSPSRKVNELDNRASHYYVALYWAQALAVQSESPKLAEQFAPVARELETKEDVIVQELIECQGHPADLGGYYRPDESRVTAAMRPSATLNAIIDGI